MNYDYEAELQRLKEQQKQQAIADLDKQKNQSLSDLNAEEATIKPTYYKKKDTANVQNQVAAKNFHEYLVNSGRSNSGIGAQYEISRQNTLQRNLNDLNTEEAGAIADIARRKTDINSAYNSGLTSANASIEANYITNLLNERQKAWEREQAQKEYEESIRQFNANLDLQRAQLYASRKKAEDEKKYEVNTPYWKGAANSDVKNGVFATKDINGQSYQPNNVAGSFLHKTGETIPVTSQIKYGENAGQVVTSMQNIWEDESGRRWLWSGTENQYKELPKGSNNKKNAIIGSVIGR